MKFTEKDIFRDDYYQKLVPYTAYLAEWPDPKEHKKLLHIERLGRRDYYQVLSYISTLFNNVKIVELGTRYGVSALALSYNENNFVISYDIIDDGQFKLLPKHNLHFVIKNVLNDIQEIQSAQIIFVDVDPHDGIKERVIFDSLIRAHFKGLLILDDICLNKGMENFWTSIYKPKYNLSHLKELNTGFGLVDFSGKLIYDHN